MATTTTRLTVLTIWAAAALIAQNRIVSTTPAITETLFALGLGSRVVGVSTYCHFPPEAASRPKIGTYLQPNLEAILRLRPDMVIMERLAPQTIDQLKRAKIRVEQINTGDLRTNLQMIEDIGRFAGAVEQARALRVRMQAEFDSMRATQQQSKRKVVFVVGRSPGRLEGIVAVGKGSYLNELIAIAGGVNVLVDSSLSYPKLSLESMIRLQPDVIIDMGDMAETVGVSDEHKRAVEALWRTRNDLKARVHAVASDIFVVPGPRMVDAARELQRLLAGVSKP
jgi:iron complex transport system substrate-binding protein